jgi:hypothetical protein
VDDVAAAAAAVQAFHWSVWVCLGATAIAVSVIITVAELLAGGERANRKGLRGWSWYCMTQMVQVRSKHGAPVLCTSYRTGAGLCAGMLMRSQ